MQGVDHKFVKKYFDVMVQFALTLGAENKTAVEEELKKALEFEILLAQVLSNNSGI